MPDDTLHSIVPRPTQVEVDEYDLLRQIRQARKTLTGEKVLYLVLTISTSQIVVNDRKIIEPVVLGL